MDTKTCLEVRDLFSELVPSFGINHAKIFCLLLKGEVKTAKQLSDESGIAHHKIYSPLKDLMGEKIVYQTNGNPSCFYMKNPSKVYEKLVSRKILALEKRPEKFDRIIGEVEDVDEKVYVLRISEKQTKLLDDTNKLLVKEKREVDFLLEKLGEYKKEITPEKEWQYAIYR